MFLGPVKEFFGHNYKSVLRLTVLLCFLYLCFYRNIPFSGIPAKNAEPIQNGVGGGSRLDAAVTENTLAFSGISGLANNAEPSFPHSEQDNIESAILELEDLSRPRTLLYSAYSVKKGVIIGDLAAEFGLNQDSLISVNGIRNTRLIQIGQVLRIPNQDGILYTVKANDTLEAIAEKNEAEVEAIQTANELFSQTIHPGTVLFIPGGRLDWVNLQEINGDLFIWPVTSRRITSSYGYRISPFTSTRQFHSGLDISSPMGNPVRAAMSGRVSLAGWDNTFGNYVIISHHSGYRTLYGHMSRIRVKAGAYVGTGELIGDVGSTGLSTGPHLHFTVYKNGVTVNPRALMK